MPIIGIGSDIVHIPRIQRALTRKWGQARFLERVFTPTELATFAYDRREAFAGHVAGRFACKEAVFKALSSIDRARWQDFSIIAGGYQEGLLSGSAGRENRRHLRVLWEKSTPLTCIIEAEDIDVQVSISHDGEYATGIAIAAKR